MMKKPREEHFELIFVGRGGQGVVTASRVLAEAALLEQKFVQSFPEFGPERSGAPVKAYARVASAPIEIRAPVEKADATVFFESRLTQVFKPVDITHSGGVVVIGCREPSKLSVGDGLQVFTLDAQEIVTSLQRPLSLNMVMLGAVASATGIVSLDSLKTAVGKKFSPVDLQALEQGFMKVVKHETG
ncbi:MAG: 2-oxoacid:acceptor oxidoreductase family protein [Candidatus Caldarchaeum sp.]|nr:2-oxoacid:acceptor oxidoreductase family protein [Candidatus Caldarchaeum sp.]